MLNNIGIPGLPALFATGGDLPSFAGLGVFGSLNFSIMFMAMGVTF